MGLRDDLDAMERHRLNGTLREFLDGTAEPLPVDHADLGIDKTAREPSNHYHFISQRGD